MVIPLLLASADTSTQNLSIFDPASPQADSIRNLGILVLAITGGLMWWYRVILRKPQRVERTEPAIVAAHHDVQANRSFGGKPSAV